MKTILRRSLGVIALCVPLLGTANLIQNGSFEDYDGSTRYPHDWNCAGNLAVNSQQGKSHGSQALAFSYSNQPSNGYIWQAFATNPGQTYSLQFDFGKYAVQMPDKVARLQVEIFDGDGISGGYFFLESVEDSSGLGVDSPDVYSPYSFTFMAQGVLTTLLFRDLSDDQAGEAGGFDAMLDNVNVAAIPEPATLTLISLLFASAFVFWRRRS